MRVTGARGSGSRHVYSAISVSLVLALVVALSAASCEKRLSGPICAQADQPRRVVIDKGMTGDFVCIPEGEPSPPGFREFPGGAPFYNSDPRWTEYSKRYGDSTNSPLSSP